MIAVAGMGWFRPPSSAATDRSAERAARSQAARSTRDRARQAYPRSVAGQAAPPRQGEQALLFPHWLPDVYPRQALSDLLSHRAVAGERERPPLGPR